MNHMKWYGKLYIGMLITVLYIPILFLMIYSFNSAGDMIHFDQFTLAHYQYLFNNDRLKGLIFNTVAVALLAPSVLVMLLTMCLITLLHLPNKKFKISLLFLNYILIVSSDVVILASFLILFTAIGHFTGLRPG